MNETNELALGDYIDVLKRRWPWVLLTLVAVLGLVAAFTFTRPKVYSSQATVLVLTDVNGDLFAMPDGVAENLKRNSIAELQYVATQEYRNAASVAAGFRSPVLIEVGLQTENQSPESSGVLRFTANENTAQRAADAANGYAQAYIETRHAQDLAAATTRRDQLDAGVARLEEERQALLVARTTLNLEAADPTIEPLRLQEIIQELADITRELDSLNTDLEAAEGQRSDAQRIIQQLEDPAGGAARTQAPGFVIDTPISPDVNRNLVLGALAGTVLGLIVAVSSDFLARRGEDGIEALAGLPILSAIGKLPKDNDAPGGVRAFTDLTHHEQSGYRVLLNSLALAQIDEPLHSLAFTSDRPDAGKTQTVLNLAQAAAARGSRVIIIDTDSINPSIAERMGLPRAGFGLGDLLDGATSLDAAINETDIPNLDLIDASSEGHYAGDHPQADKLRDLLDRLRGRYDLALLDCAPVLSSADPRVIVSQADAAVVVYQPERDRQNTLLQAIELLRAAHSNLIGLVANRSSESHPLYAYNYGNYGNYGGNGAVPQGNGHRGRSAAVNGNGAAPAPAPAPRQHDADIEFVLDD
jgi:capsular exopolysaccharide synthesis family protein